jgi:hypothetical protein
LEPATSGAMDKLSHQITMLCTFVLFLKFLMTTLVQGGKRFAGGTRPPEDGKVGAIVHDHLLVDSFVVSYLLRKERSKLMVLQKLIIPRPLKLTFVGKELF